MVNQFLQINQDFTFSENLQEASQGQQAYVSLLPAFEGKADSSDIHPVGFLGHNLLLVKTAPDHPRVNKHRGLYINALTSNGT